jgi:hypothetical protein
MAGEITGAVMFVARIAIALAAVDADFHDGLLLKQHSGAALSKNMEGSRKIAGCGRGTGGRCCNAVRQKPNCGQMGAGK